MPSDIKNPYAVVKTAAATYAVMFRYMIGKDIRWKAIAHRMDKPVATKICALLNKNLGE